MRKGDFAMKGKMNKMFKEMQKAQEQITKLQEELKEREIESTSGGGAVRAVVSGGKELKELKIDPELLKEDDVEMLQDLIISAVNDAMNRADEMVSQEMEKLTGGMGLPPNLF